MTRTPRPAAGPPPPTDPSGGPRILRTSQPAELLAETQLAMGAPPRDSLVLIGHGGGSSRPLFSRTDLRHLCGPASAEHVEHHLSAVRAQGHPRAVALFVLGDGHEPLPPGLLGRASGLLGALLLRAARELLPDPVRIDACWVLGDGTGLRVLPGASGRDGVEVAVSPPCPLTPVRETAAAAHAVLEGRTVPTADRGQDAADERLLCALGARLAAHPTLSSPSAAARASGRGAADEEERARTLPGTVEAARAVMGRVLARGEQLGGHMARASSAGSAGSGPADLSMTDCEPLAELILLLGVGMLDWRLFALCVSRGRAEPLPAEDLLDHLVEDPSLTPHVDVRAGGAWFRDLQRLRVVCGEIAGGPAGPAAGAGEAAWRATTAVLTLLHWWDHRFASAADLIEELWEVQPDSSLAPLLARLIDPPISPAWRPGS